MRIATWNVNSLRARHDLVFDWIEQNEPDILCLQETKLVDQEFPEDEFGDLDYDVVYFGQPSYNGVAIAAKEEILDVVRGFPSDTAESDKRLIAATIGGIRVIDVYVPNGQDLESDKYPFKLAWLENLRRFLDDGPAPETPVLLCGDFNIAPLDIDVWNPEERQGHLFVSEPERTRFQALLDWGLVDSFRHFEDGKELYSWWDYRGGSHRMNRGMRIDHILVSQPLLDRAIAVTIDKAMRAQEGPSDHAPVIIELAD